jgi:hypothetical protein
LTSPISFTFIVKFSSDCDAVTLSPCLRSPEKSQQPQPQKIATKKPLVNILFTSNMQFAWQKKKNLQRILNDFSQR